MSDFEDKINQVLSSPDTMEQIMSIARSLGVGNNQPAPSSESEEKQTDLEQLSPSIANLRSLFENGDSDSSGIDPKITSLLLRVASAWNEPNDQKVALLNALRPFLKKERAEKIQKAMQIAKISRIVRIALDILKGGDDTV